MSRESEILMNYLVPGNAGDELIVEFATLYAARRASEGFTTLPIAEFYQPGDADRWRMARDAWPQTAPRQLALPDLGTIAQNIARYPPLEPTTFMGALTTAWERVSMWLVERGGDPNNPNETKEQRRSRKAREAQARYRDRTTKSADPGRQQAAAEAQRLYEVYMDACRHRKLIDAEQAELVRQANEAYIAAKKIADVK